MPEASVKLDRAGSRMLLGGMILMVAALLAGCGGNTVKQSSGNVRVLGNGYPTPEQVQEVCGEHPLLNVDQYETRIGFDTRVVCSPSVFVQGRTSNVRRIGDGYANAKDLEAACAPDEVLGQDQMETRLGGFDTWVVCVTPGMFPR